MPRKCCMIPGCKYNLQTILNNKCSLHKIPDNQEYLKIWSDSILQNTGMRIPYVKDRQSFLICSLHFDDVHKIITVDNRVRLRSCAVPTLFHNEGNCYQMETETFENGLPFDDIQNIETNEDEDKMEVEEIEWLEESLDLVKGIERNCWEIKEDSGISIRAETESDEQMADLMKKPTPKTIRYVGDIRESDFDKPTRSKIAYRKVLNLYLIEKNQKRRYKQSYQRAILKIKKLEMKITQLKTENGKFPGATNILQVLPTNECSILKKLITNTRVGKSYCEEIKKFAVTLNFYSPRAYEFVRKSFNNQLPATVTIKQWYTTMNGEPGISVEALETIKAKVIETKQTKNKKLIGCLMFDEVYIRQHTSMCAGKPEGYVNLGFGIDQEPNEIATEALVFMVNMVNDSWKIPVAYYFVGKLKGEEKVILLLQVLEHVISTGLILAGLTFDGLSNNLKVARLIGASFDEDTLNPTITCEGQGDDISGSSNKLNVFIDPSHGLKLVRNTLSRFVLIDNAGEKINWSFIERLNSLQNRISLHLGNKLRNLHVNFQKNKMKTKLAIQTLSLSVSDALEYLEKRGEPEFQNCGPTINFIRTFNYLFDILNSKSKFGKNFTRPICKETEDEYFAFFDYAETYIRQLKIICKGREIFILDSPYFTGFLSFLVNMKSFKEIYFRFVAGESPMLEYILCYKFSQDHLEQLFCLIRARNGFNDNPTTIQFKAAYKRLLLHNNVTVSKNANCFPQDDTQLSTIQPGKSLDMNNYNKSLTENDVEEYEEYMLKELDPITSDIVTYIAGFVERRLWRLVKCSECLRQLTCDEMQVSNLLIETKWRGFLTKPQENIVFVCKIAEQIFKLNIHTFNIAKMTNLTLRTVFENNENIFKMDHETKKSFESHQYTLLKMTVEIYLKIRQHHQCRIKNEEMQTKRFRNFNKKMVQFAGL